MRLALAVAVSILLASGAVGQYLPDGAQTWTLSPADGAAQYVMEFGNARAVGDTIVVVHGGFGAEHSYLIDPLLPLADRYHFVLYDQRGSLRSQVAPGADSLLRFPAFVDDLEALRVQLGLDQLTILAHSMGGIVSYGYLDRYPERVRGLALLVPAPPALSGSFEEPPSDPRLVPPSDSAAARARIRRLNESAERRLAAVIAQEGFPDPESVSEAQVLTEPGLQKALYNRYRATIAAYNTCHPERWRQLRGFGRAFYTQRVADAVFSDENLPAFESAVERMIPALEAFEGPVAFVVGDCDYLDPEGVITERLAGRLRRPHVRVLRDAGHLFWIDAPEESTGAIAAALAHATSQYTR